MLTTKVQGSPTAMQNLSLKMPEGIKSKTATPRHPILVKQQYQQTRMTPSAFAQEMSMSTEQRLACVHIMHPPQILELLDMSATTHQKFSSVDLDQAIFQPFPSEIVFQNYTAFETYKMQLALRNKDKVPRLVKVVEEDSVYFKVVGPVDVCSKVAPGMASTFTVLFTPHENKDYIHQIVCVTERERFVVPIRAVGARAMLDFPDHVHFPVSPVKCPSERTLLVRNVGNCEAKFHLSTQRPFTVEPTLGTLGVGESMQVTLVFLAKTSGDHTEDLLLHYHTGEDIYISLYGAAVDVNVRLDRNSVIMEKTYISMASQRSVVIANRSDAIVHYQWKGFNTEEEEENLKLKSCLELQREEEKMEQFVAERDTDLMHRDRLSLLSHTFHDRSRQLQEERLFSDDHIIISPMEGDIWPNTTAEINVIFKPQEARIYQQTVYCDVSGRESRLPLRIKGEGVGPKLQFNIDLLDMGNIFIESKHTYEVLLSNKGYIDAPFCLVPPSSAQGLCFSFTPSEGMVPPGSCHAIAVSFCSGNLGTFIEEFFFSVGGNPQPISVTFRGCVMGPTFQFSVPELNFGDVSFGFPHTLTCCLTNTSLVPMTFDLRILGDGSGPLSVTSVDQVSDLNRTEWGARKVRESQPTEFTLSPSSGTVRALGLMDIQVTLCSNTVRSYSTALVVDVRGVGEEVMALPIHARCVVPTVRLDTSVLELLQCCFLDHRYETSVELVNNSELPVCYGLLPQEYEEQPAFLFSSPNPRGIIEPRSQVQLPLVVQVKTVGGVTLTAHVAVFGSEEPPLDLILSCTGEGPVVCVSPAELDFGNISVLVDVSRTLKLLNQSPIPACFVATMVRRRSQWRVEPSEGVVPPEGELHLRLVAHLDDTVHFQDKLHLAIQHSQTYSIPVSAKGKGTTIVTDRPFAPHLDLGDHFSSGPCTYQFKVTNRGRRSHQLYWMTEGFPPFRHRPSVLSEGHKSRSPQQALEPDGPVFVLEPLRVDLAPGQSVDMVLCGSSDTPKVVQEKLVCQAIVGQQTGKEVIMMANVTCRFVAPVLDISSRELRFYVEKAPGVPLVPFCQPLVLRNTSSLTLSMKLILLKPFALCDHPDDSSFVTSKLQVLDVGQQVQLWVLFDPSYGGDSVSRVAEEVLEIRYEEHPQRDSVSLRGEVHFPNLHFSDISVDFGCILNHTDTQRQLTMTNYSPLPVLYHWAFMLDQLHCCIRFPQESKVDIGQDPVEEDQTDPQMDQTEMRDGVDQMVSTGKIEDAELSVEGRGTEDMDFEPDSVARRASTRDQNLSVWKERNWTSLSQHLHKMELTPIQHSTLGAQEVFDILPLYGELQPGESQLVNLTFYGYANISSQVLALCEVEEGPTYEITLRGEASRVTYSLNTTDIELGAQPFDCVAETEIFLRNTGRIPFEFKVLLDLEGEALSDPQPGLPLILPNMGQVKANTEQKLSVYYLPGTPEVFEKAFQLQVSYFEPERITVRGEGIFPRICLDLPRSLDEGQYRSVLEEARESLDRERQKGEEMSRPETRGGDQSVYDCMPTYDALLQMEVERLLVRDYATTMEADNLHYGDRQASRSSQHKRLSRFFLPEYKLDFGCVIHGSVPTHIVKVTNTAPLPVSFYIDHHHFAGTGFSMELDKVRNLPYCETETFEVKFDPHGANLDLGEVNIVIPIQVVGGPTVQVCLCALVTMPSLTISMDTVQFGMIQCGQCKVVTVQLFNPEPVSCEWFVTEDKHPKKKVEKHVPLHLRQRSRQDQKASPPVFEILPHTGLLLPGDRVNVQVKFTPTEGREYSQLLVISVAQSSQRVKLLAQGQGEEPQLEFSSLVLKLGPTVPCTRPEEAEVVVRNPCSFPIEFYSLEFDKQYLEEEKILCVMKGYDAHNVLLLPPRAPGESLPPELLEFFREQSARQQDEEPKIGTPKKSVSPESTEGDGETGNSPAEEAQPEESENWAKEQSLSGELTGDADGGNGSVSVGELEADPVSRAIARHLGIDLSPEGQAVRSRRGIAIIVHGAPLSGKTVTAVTLAKHYGAACLSIDAVVLEALSSGAGTAGLHARQLCARAALEYTQKKVEEAAQTTADFMGLNNIGASVLSMEALAKHTSEGSQVSELKPRRASMSTRRNTSVGAGRRINMSQPTATSQSMQTGPEPKLLSVSGSIGGDVVLMSCVLPEQLLVDILSERLQLSDCHQGVVIDALDTMYSRSVASTLQVVLKAFNNRRFIYVVDLSYTFEALQTKEKAEREAEENRQRENEERKKVWLQEMDEDEYDALSEEEKKLIEQRRLEELRERKHRQLELSEREQEERRCQEEIEKLQEEEVRKKKNKLKKEPVKEDVPGKKSQLGGKQSSAALRSETKLDQAFKETRRMSVVVDTETAKEQEDGAKKRKIKEGKTEEQDEAPTANEEKDRDQLPPNQERTGETERLLLSRFRQYEQSQDSVAHILQHWDRAQGLLLKALSSEEQFQGMEEPATGTQEQQALSNKRSRKEREREKEKEKEKDRLEKDKLRADAPDPRLPLSSASSQAQLVGDIQEGADGEALAEAVPHLVLPVSGREHPSGMEIIQSGRLPALEEVLDGLGLGPKGPPVPPPAIFSVVAYPSKRPVLREETQSCFSFMSPAGAEDSTENKKELEADVDTLASVPLIKEGTVTPTKGRARKADVGRESQKEKRRYPAKKGTKAPEPHSPPASATVVSDSQTGLHPTKAQHEQSQKVTTFRWIIPPKAEVKLKIWYYSSVPGTFDQTLNFEVMGTRRRYQLHCRGVSAYPFISKDHNTVFAHCKKALLPDGNLQKAYITRSGVYHFGPLLCGKNRDRYKEGRYPENMERLVMHNSSPLEAEIHCCFELDTKATTFMLDPPILILKPNERQELMVWAYPTTPGLFEDCVVCCVVGNPEPAIFRFSCQGVRPELNLDRKQLHFDKVLLNRKVTKSLCLRNSSLLPIAWNLSGLEALGEEFSVSHERGVIPPQSECSLQLHFRACRPVNLKKVLRLEVLDVDNVLGVVYTENIQVQAEAYDVNFDITFPKGTNMSSSKSDGTLEFGTIKVSEEMKISLTLKNKGKYEVGFKFLLQPTDQVMPDPNSFLTITPSKGSLLPSERPTTVHFVFRHDKEVFLREQPIVNLQVIEPNITEGGEVIGLMPIKVSVQSVFSKYSILPSGDINFGPLLYGSRKSRAFTIVNRGEFEIRFSICRTTRELPANSQKKGTVPVKRAHSRESHSARAAAGAKLRRSESIQKEMGSNTQARLSVGMFTVAPGFGVLAPGAQQAVTVDCIADQVGSWEECLALDITDRDPNDHPSGIPYRLSADVCMPGITSSDAASIFEEHHVCKNSNLLSCEQFRDARSIYVQDENKFVFNNVLVGQSAKAHFRISNSGKVPCELSLAVKSVSGKMSVRAGEVFEVTPSRTCIPSHQHVYAEVTFSPQSMQSYSAVFEATLEGPARSSPMAKTKALVFDLYGEGNLPRVVVLRPLLQTPQGNPLLQFRHLLLGRSQTLPLLLKNDGSVPAQVNIGLLDEMGVFSLRAARDTVCTSVSPFHLDNDSDTERKGPQRVAVVLTMGQQMKFEVEFRPNSERIFEARLCLLVLDNQYEETVVHLLGGGYNDVITLDHISSKAVPEKDTAEDHMSDILHFGDCHVGKPYQETFTITNHSNSDVLRFEWPPDSQQVKFSPRTGHLHAGCTKDVMVSFCSEQPVVLSAQPFRCKLCQVVFPLPVDQVHDWDDRLRTVKWVDAEKSAATPRPAKKKVTETHPEPAHSVVENSSRELELRISAVCDYTKFTCSTESIRFKETLLYQTRVFQFHMENTGSVQLEFTWQVLMEQCGRTLSFVHGGASRAATPGTALRPATALESMSNLLLMDPHLPPFSIEPSAGTVSPGGSLTFCVRFSPLELSDWDGRLICSVPNLKEGQGPAMAVSGRSLLPYCHFHLEDSDYLTSGRRNSGMYSPHGGPPRTTVDPNTRVIEFTSVGVGTSVQRVFSIVNPTAKAYSFMWKNEDLEESPFKCLAPRGFVQSGKKAEICFEFQAQDLSTVESFWTFLLLEQSMSVPFLLVGTAGDPEVYMNQAHLNLGSLLIGHVVHEMVYIINKEDVPFHFSIRETSCHSEAFIDSLKLKPLRGIVEAHDRFPLAISFSPTQEGPVVFKLVCDVKGKVQPLTMNVKAEGFSLSACVQCRGPDGEMIELSSKSTHHIDFKQVELGDKSSYHFLVSNPGKVNLDAQFMLWGPSQLLRHLQVEPNSTTVVAGGESLCTMTFYPLQKCALRDTGLSITVRNGPSYRCSFSGSAVTPSIKFSFLKHNFGMNFLYCAGMTPASKTLVISNKGEQPVSLRCLFHNTAHLEVSFQPQSLLPGGVMEVPITFYPQEVMQYKEKVVFEINQRATQAVEILGQGIQMQINVEDPKHKVLGLGALRIGQKTRSVIPVVNNSQAPVTFSLLLSPSLHMLVDSKVLSVNPAGEVTLKAGGGHCSIELLFSPRHRMAPFKEELQLECLGAVRPLLVLQGSCQGIEIQLDQDCVSFGAVVKGCQATRCITMTNTGDMGARFKWDTKAFAPDFSITPTEGYISPEAVVTFNVTFAPVELSQDLCYEDIPCSIEGVKPIRLALSGSCIAPSVTKEVVSFACQVRSQHTQAILLSNHTSQLWTLKPVLKGEHWTGPPSFVIEAGQYNKPYEVTYKPLVMSTDGKKHQGSVFFSFPDGTAMLYSLVGTSEPPKPAGNISREIPCKTPYTELLSVQNWLAKPQRFRALIDILKPDRPDNTISLKGLDYLDVPASSKKDYKLSFFTYRECQVNAKVTFRNEVTQEYLFYYLSFRATAPGVIHTIELVTAIRQTASTPVMVENPLGTGLYFTAECRSGDIFMPPQLFVPSMSTGTLVLEYQPLRPGDSTVRLTLHNSELGHFHYELLLRALPAPPEKPLCYQAQLGSSQSITAKFMNYSRAKAEYTCKTESQDFTVEKSISAAAGFQAGTEVSVEVCFEPCQLGESRANLTLSSSLGGEYIFPLIGTCTIPKAQGPFSVRSGSSVSIPFKNVFLQATTFSFQVNNPAFSVRGTETVRSKKVHHVVVSYESPPSYPSGPCVGKLTVSSPHAEGCGQAIRWVFYLKGLGQDPTQRSKASSRPSDPQ